MSGFFVQEAATCFVALMIIEKSDPEAELTATATRVRLVLNPGQIAGLDSEEGYSVNLTCGESAKTMLADFGNREKLMALQACAPRRFDDIISGSLTKELPVAWIGAQVATSRLQVNREQFTGGTSASARVGCGMTSRSLCKQFPVPDL
jgi:hypothetical protein